ncbi:MAG: rhamnan synthesis F family protein [Roseovarius sp.]
MNLDELWLELAPEAVTANRPDFRYNRDFYLANSPDLVEGKIDPDKHYESHGRRDGRLATAYDQVSRNVPDLDDRLATIALEPRLREAIRAGEPDAAKLLFELTALGDPVDLAVSQFSARFYLGANPDVRDAGVHPFLHFIQHGIREARRTLSDVRQNRFEGRRRFDPSRPTVIIGVHECSKTGAPIVGLKLIRSAAKTHNVITVSLRGGELLERFIDESVEVLISANPDEDFDYLQSEMLKLADTAILNSVECFPFAKPLIRYGIPWASYLHEYTDYSLPAYKCIFMALYSDLLVFSSAQVRNSWKFLMADVDFDLKRDSMILPQQEFRVGGIEAKEHAEAIRTLSDLIGIDCTNRRVVLGAGHVQWRKGTDLFVLTAQIARSMDDDTVFVWIGDGQNHEDVHFGVWLDKHMREAGANAPGGTLHFLPAGPYYNDLCKAADAFFLSSRLDPLPNVVFDAAENGCHTVLFQNASGFDDPRYTEEAGISVVEYGNLDAACKALLNVPRKTPAARHQSAATDQVGDIFQTISDALRTRLQDQKQIVIGGGQYDVPILFSSGEELTRAREAERDKIWTFGRRFVWPSLRAAQARLAESDNWVDKTCRIEKYAPFKAPEAPEYSVHIHAHYTDGLGGDLLYYSGLRRASRIVVTTDSDKKERQIAHIARDAGIDLEVIRMPNTGRDILPFLRLFSDGHAGEDELWCHIHQKKSIGTMRSGETWKKFLLSILLGSDTERSDALRHIADPKVGLVAPFDPYQVSWAGARRLLPRFESEFDQPLPDHPIFPVGNMFWARGAVVARMNDIFGPNYPWPNEPLPNDGTEFHLIERLWPAAAALAGYSSVFLEKADQKRG